MDILSQIVKQRKIQLAKEKSNYEIASFKQVLKKSGLSIIGEMKRASPSKGQIANENFNILEQAKVYQEKGVDAYSVLTEQHFFKGKNNDLFSLHHFDKKRPILRKDFIFDAHQIFEAKLLGASAILLIVRILSDEQLAELHGLAQQLGLDVLVEVHDEGELKRALKIPKLEIIGINNRNLDTFETDIKTTEKLLKNIPDRREYIVVSESGFLNSADIKWAEALGVDALLIGEGLMKGLI